jgi:hypothetical protein
MSRPQGAARRDRLSYVFRRGQREARDFVLRRGASDHKTIREDVALQFLRGEGIEIGALDFPLPLIVSGGAGQTREPIDRYPAGLCLGGARKRPRDIVA